MEFLPLLLLPVLVIWAIGWLLVKGIEGIVNLVRFLRDRRRARIEAELDRTQAELRRTMFALAEQLNLDAHEARKALIRESFLASGRVPEKQ